ncbi:MAG TPA: AraC family transcriptional regulator [Vicinamibacteria bacterium]
MTVRARTKRRSRPRPLPAWASGSAIRFALSVLRARGWPTERLMERAGLSALVSDPEARLPHAGVRAFWREAIRETGDETIGLHVAKQVRPAVFDALGYVFRFSPTLGDGICRLARYHRFVDDVLELVVETDGRHACIRLEGVERMTRPTAEFLLGSLIRAARAETARPDLDPVGVQFAFARPRRWAEHRRFFRSPLWFGCPRNALVLERKALDLPMRAAEPELREVLERRVRDVIARLPPVDTVATRARFELGETLDGGHPTAKSVGRKLGLSVRSLHRRLRDEGTTFGGLLDALRRELAERYLREGVSVSETAFLLGYSDASAFHRAFRRWTNSTPASYRRRRP